MKSRRNLLRIVLVLGVILACNLPRGFQDTPIPENASATSEPSIAPSTWPTSTITATSAPIGVFTLAVLVDRNSEPVSREEAQIVVAEASQILYGLTKFTFEMVDFNEVSGEVKMDGILQKYLSNPAAVRSDGIIIFSYGDDGTAKLYGGYAFAYPGPGGFKSRFVSSYAKQDSIYIGVIHFGHRYAACGYGGAETPVSPVSIDGECRGQPGIACTEKYGYQMCSLAINDLAASTPTYFTSSSFVHEIMHPFGKWGAKDHFWTPECTEIMKSGLSKRNYNDAFFDSAESEQYVNMCPYVFDNFIGSYQP